MRNVRTKKRKNRSISKFSLLALLLTLGATAGASAAVTNDPMSDLLDMMIQKGMLTESEAQKVRVDSDAHRASNAVSKWRIDKSIKDIELYGDVRFRYENRQVQTPDNNRVELGRFRYSLRVGLRGELADNFYYGMRVETGPNPRSPWLTFGTSSSGVPYQGPSGKSTAGLNLGQVYLGWKPKSWLDITVGKMPNPIYTTPLVWDADIAPEGASEKFKHTIGKADLFLNLGQFLYQDVNPTRASEFIFPSIPFGQDTTVPFLLSWQAGVNYHIDKEKSFKAAATLYNYIGHGGNTAPGGSPLLPGFADRFVGEGAGIPTNGVSGYPGGNYNGFAFNQTGINDLLVLEFPVEFNFKLRGLNARVYGDFAENLNGSARAAGAVQDALTNNTSISLAIPLEKNENKAYLVGMSIGNGDSLGLVYGSPLKKGTWEARAYWQHIEQYALDPNLIDSDFFEGKLNEEGFYGAFAYSFTDAIVGTLRYGYANRVNKKLGTGGSNQDIPQVNPANSYQLIQADLSWKF